MSGSFYASPAPCSLPSYCANTNQIHSVETMHRIAIGLDLVNEKRRVIGMSTIEKKKDWEQPRRSL